MSESDIVRVNISIAAVSSPTVANLNTGLIAAFHTHYVDRVRVYSTASVLTQMVTDGFSTFEPAYLAAEKYASAPNAPALVCIGRRSNPPLQTLQMTCVDGTVNDAYDFVVVGSDGKSNAVHYANVINPGPAIPATALTGTVTVTLGSPTLLFSATQTLAAGTLLVFSSQPGIAYVVSAATSSSTAATLTTPYTGATAAGATTTPGATTSVTNGSTAVTFSQSQSLTIGTLLTFASQPGVYYALSAAVVASTSGTLTVAYGGTTNAATATQFLASLAGTFDAINGSPLVASTSSQVSAVLPGDSIEFVSQIGTTYTVLSVTASTVTLTQPYSGGTSASTKAADVCQITTAANYLQYLLTQIAHIGTATVTGSSSTIVQLARTDGSLTDIQDWVSNGFASIQLADTTADPGVVADLTAMVKANGAAFYAVMLDSNSAAEIEATAAYIEATGNGGKIFLWNNSDYGNTQTLVTSDVFSELQLDSYVRNLGVQNSTQVLCYLGASLASNALARNPGSYSFAFMTAPGIPADTDTTLPEGQQLALNSMTASNPGPGAKNGNWYKDTSGENIVFPGTAPSGRFFDLTLLVDWLYVTIQQAMFEVLVANAAIAKTPFTDFGLAQLGNAVDGVLRLGSTPAYGGILPDGQDPKRPIKVTVAPVASISVTDRANRNLPSSALSWSAGITGAVETATVAGTLLP